MAFTEGATAMTVLPAASKLTVEKENDYYTFYRLDGAIVAHVYRAPGAKRYRVYAPSDTLHPSIFTTKRAALAYIEKTVATDAQLARHGSMYTRPLDALVGRG